MTEHVIDIIYAEGSESLIEKVGHSIDSHEAMGMELVREHIAAFELDDQHVSDRALYVLLVFRILPDPDDVNGETQP